MYDPRFGILEPRPPREPEIPAAWLEKYSQHFDTRSYEQRLEAWREATAGHKTWSSVVDLGDYDYRVEQWHEARKEPWKIRQYERFMAEDHNRRELYIMEQADCES